MHSITAAASTRTNTREHSRNSSIGSETPTTPVSPIVPTLPYNLMSGRPACYVAYTAAASHVFSEQKARVAERFEGQPSSTAQISTPIFNDGSLLLINAFLDQLLYQFLGVARSTTLTALRPAVAQVLKGKLARQAIAAADEELEDLLGADKEDQELELLRTASEKQPKWDTDAVFRRVRTKVTVYMSLADIDDDNDESETEDEEQGLVSWAASIFLTSVMECIAEQCLSIAGQAAYERVTNKAITQQQKETEVQSSESVLITEQDVDRITLTTTLGRLWRAWRKSVRTGKHRTSTSSQQSELGGISNQGARASVSSIMESRNEQANTDEVATQVVSENEVVLPNKPPKLQLGEDPALQLAIITEIDTPSDAHATQRVLDEYRDSIIRTQSRRPQSLLLYPSSLHSYPTPEASPNRPLEIDELKKNAKRRKYLSLPNPYRLNFPVAELAALGRYEDAENAAKEIRKSRHLSKGIQTQDDEILLRQLSTTEVIDNDSPPVTPIEDDDDGDTVSELDDCSPSPVMEEETGNNYKSSVQAGNKLHQDAVPVEDQELQKSAEDVEAGTDKLYDAESFVTVDSKIDRSSLDVKNIYNESGEVEQAISSNGIEAVIPSSSSSSFSSPTKALDTMHEPSGSNEEAPYSQKSSTSASDWTKDTVLLEHTEYDPFNASNPVRSANSSPSVAMPHSSYPSKKSEAFHPPVQINTSRTRIDDRRQPYLDVVPENIVQDYKASSVSAPSPRSSTDQPIGSAKQFIIGEMVEKLTGPGSAGTISGYASNAERQPSRGQYQPIGSISATRAAKDTPFKRSAESTPPSVKSRPRRTQGSQASSVSDASSEKRSARDVNAGPVSPVIDDRASIKRVSSDSPRMSSSKFRNGNADSSYTTRKTSRQSSETLESLTPGRTSEALEKDFAFLLATEEPVKLTLTPRELYEIEQPGSPRHRTDEISGFTTDDIDDHDDDIATGYPGMGLNSGIGPKKTNGYIPRSRPAVVARVGPSHSNMVARDARPRNESIRDFADFIKSSAPPTSYSHDFNRSPANSFSTPKSTNSISTFSSADMGSKSSKVAKASETQGEASTGTRRTFTQRPVSGFDFAPSQSEGRPSGSLLNADFALSNRSTDLGNDTPIGVSRSGSAQNSLNSGTALLSNPPVSVVQTKLDGKTRRRIKDPYQIDCSDEEDNGNYYNSQLTRLQDAQSQNLMEFLLENEPPKKLPAQGQATTATTTTTTTTATSSRQSQELSQPAKQVKTKRSFWRKR